MNYSAGSSWQRDPFLQRLAECFEHQAGELTTSNERLARVTTVDRRLKASDCVEWAFPSVTGRIRQVGFA